MERNRNHLLSLSARGQRRTDGLRRNGITRNLILAQRAEHCIVAQNLDSVQRDSDAPRRQVALDHRVALKMKPGLLGDALEVFDDAPTQREEGPMW